MSEEWEKKSISKSEDEYREMVKKAKKAYGNKLDFLEGRPKAKKKPRVPFPFGGNKARPYGWYLK